ncbi:hypothetical protein INT44_007957 [Umbelopsis vinacea]|uniref:TauD/TfdA-like domain-containing protein n=1 Tax=Umbelopsis vinacea TaxID=44442 RepID=A0A8H7PP00_9FUNG|nr:hypothetical protein INT44_007957 [Umbelopsis vinacea]
MAPSETKEATQQQTPIEAAKEAIKEVGKTVESATEKKPEYIREPLKLKGVLDQYKSFEVTPIIGKEFPDAQITDWLAADNADDLIRDLAITISQRGVVFFRAQKDLTNDIQKVLVQKLGELSGKPSTSTLHIHPIINAGRGTDISDNEISVISSELNKKLYSKTSLTVSQSAAAGWHSDITFEPIPSDYTLLKLVDLPSTGGDTLWASGYEVYDRISKPYQKFLDTLTATYAQPGFNEAAKNNGFEIYDKQRGAPENVGSVLKAIHPVIRTNPVTGWKSVFAVGSHCARINDLSERESKHLLDTFRNLITENHDLQVRHRWLNKHDLAIWDNRSVYHAATFDYDEKRTGHRAVGLGERPYYDPASVSRREALGKNATVA